MKSKLNLKSRVSASLAAAFVLVFLLFGAAESRAASGFGEIFKVSPSNIFADEKSNLTNGLNGRIVFASDRDGDSEIYTMNPDGWGIIKLTDNLGNDNTPSFSADGSKIVFVSQRNGAQNIYIMNADGSNQTAVPNTELTLEPKFSPDGNRIVYSCWDESNNIFQICTINTDGSGKTFLTTSNNPSYQPTYSPDGSKIAFVNCFVGHCEIFTMNSANGGNMTQLTNYQEFGYSQNPSYSPDGGRIVFTGKRNGNEDIYTITADGSIETRLTEVPTIDGRAAYSPDGTKIVFISSRAGNREIFTMDADGDNQRRTASGVVSMDSTSWQSAVTVPPSMSIADVLISEPTDGTPAPATFNVSLSFPSMQVVTVDYELAYVSATPNYDYTFIPAGQIVFTPGETSKQISVPVLADLEDETVEKFHVNLSNPIGAVIEKARGVGSIRSDYGRNGKISFTALRENNNEIYEMNADGTNPRNLSNSAPYGDFEASYSPDGSRIVFVSTRGGKREIYVMQADGSDQTRLTDNDFNEEQPSFSPDGSRIIFSSNMDGNQDIYTMSANGSDVTRLTNNSATDSSPSYSPDGEKIVFISTRQENIYKLYTMNADGSNERLFSEQSRTDYFPSYSPDGSKILFISYREGRAEIYTVNVDGSNLLQLTNNTETESFPSFSTDGRLITFTKGAFDDRDIFVMNADGTNQTPLTNGLRADDNARWQPLPNTRCTYEFSPSSINAIANGAEGSITVTASDASCHWNASSSVDWISVYNGEHTGNGSFYITIPRNLDYARQGAINVGLQTIPVNQQEGVVDIAVQEYVPARNNQPLILVPVFLVDHLTDEHNVISFDFEITYDPAVIQPREDVIASDGTAAHDFEINYNTGSPGTIRVSGFSTTPMPGAMYFLNFKFKAVGNPGDCSRVNFTSFQFNDGIPRTRTTGGDVCLWASVAGRVFYGNSLIDKPIRDVTMQVTGDSYFSDTTGIDGNYLLNRFGRGTAVVTPAKQGDVNGISALDASIVSRAAVGLDVLSEYKRAAADVSGNGSVNSFDAALIARYAASLPSPLVGVWKFLPATRTYVDLHENLTGENYVGVLMGEVTGNWTAFGENVSRQSNKSLTAPANAVPVALPSLEAGRNQIVNVPISTGDVTGRNFLAYDLEIAFDPAVLQIDAANPIDKTGTVSANLTVVANTTTPGRLLVTAYGIDYMQGAGTLLNLRFRVVGQGGQVSPLAFQRMIFNEDASNSVTQDGQIRALSPTSAAVEIGGRVTTAKGTGIPKATVTIIDANGSVRTALTNGFGYYTFPNTPVGASYVLRVLSKQHTFPQPERVVTVNDSLTDLNFVAEN